MHPYLLITVTGLHALAAGLAVRLARLSPAYRPVGFLLCGSLVAELVRWGNRVVVLAGAPRPLTGWWRVAGHLEQGLYLTWPAGVVAVTWWALRRRDRRPWRMLLVPLLYLGVLGWLVTHYPAIRASRLEAVYCQVHLGEIAACAGAWGIYLRRMLIDPDWPMSTQRAAAILFAAEVALFGGPFWARSPFAEWDLAALVYGVLYLRLALVQWSASCRLGTGQRIGSSPSSPSSP